MKVLVADDSSVMRKIVIRTLRQAGFGNLDILEAADGAEIVDMVSKQDFDLIMSDWNMPNMTGIEALRAVRGSGCTVTFGFVTSESSDSMKGEAEAAGAAFFVTKPFTADAFEQQLGAFVA